MSNATYPSSGPPSVRLYTWCGLSNLWKAASISAPWPPPLLEFTSTRSGWLLGGNSSGCGEGGRDKMELRWLITGLQKCKSPAFNSSQKCSKWPWAKGRLGSGDFTNQFVFDYISEFQELQIKQNWLFNFLWNTAPLCASRAVARKNLWLRQCPWVTYDRGNLSMVEFSS